MSYQGAYAPTPYSYIPSSSLSATINLDEEVKLSTTPAERDLNDSLAEIYSIIVTLEALEKAYLRDSIPEAEYTETCRRLLKQYKSNLEDESVARAFDSLENFKRDWNVCQCSAPAYSLRKPDFQQVECPRATDRIRKGLPATVVEPTATRSSNTGSNNPPGATAALLLASSENFITLSDAIKIGMLSKDTLHPLLVETIQAVNKVTDREFEGKEKIVQWLITLNQMRATQDLSQEQGREMDFDMQRAYQGFKSILE